MHQRLANATFQIICGDNRGSGFSFFEEEFIITNFHVIESSIDSDKGIPIFPTVVMCEDGQGTNADIVAYHPDRDIALLKINDALPPGRVVLKPATSYLPERGRKLIFSGFPHGIHPLLTHEAIISAEIEGGMFCIDGMVNKGNSGGPIIDAETGEVVGVVSAKRFRFNEEAEELSASAVQIKNALDAFPKNHVHIVQNIDIGRFNKLMTESLILFTKMLAMNANTGIGIVHPISWAVNVIEDYKGSK
ncbi:TPA: trypsin-like peptidase domain-containing protein [Enterobacter kobei]|nr:trypsin-like peptidase domain-containing protein [Enterobacter kobei]